MRSDAVSKRLAEPELQASPGSTAAPASDSTRTFRDFWNFYATIYDQKKAAFDAYLRPRNVRILERCFPPGLDLLDLGCGTGTEAEILRRHGCTVTLVDLSFEMLRRARVRVPGAPLVNLAAEDIGCLRKRFGGAYASFGVFNCLRQPERFAAGLAEVLEPGARFVASVVNRLYWGDVLLWALGKTNFLRHRLRGGGRIVVDGKEHEATARFYSVSDVRRLMPDFELERCFALPVILPPTYLRPHEKLSPRVFRSLVALEDRLWDKPGFNRLGEQSVLILRRR